ncbi:HEAT repeat domain-containing protein [Gimesia sp.]|uniref:HEAT repeat domain-containing protein n=1 Tax=Gimesia sp. TaxID=2024833 RepID=UPI003A8D26D2
MREDQVIQLCKELLRGCSEESLDNNSSPMPSYLLDIYFRVNFAKELANHPMSIMISATLLRSALTANEDDRIRIESVQQLLNTDSPFVELVLFGLLFDEDELMRETAVEGLAVIRSQNLELALSIISDDEFTEIPDTLRKALAGEYDSIKLYHIDPPPDCQTSD